MPFLVDSDVVITAGHSGYKKPAVYGERYENGCYISANDTCAYNSINCTDTTSKDKCGTRVIADLKTSSLAVLLANRIETRMNGGKHHSTIYMNTVYNCVKVVFFCMLMNL